MIEISETILEKTFEKVLNKQKKSNQILSPKIEGFIVDKYKETEKMSPIVATLKECGVKNANVLVLNTLKKYDLHKPRAYTKKA